MVDAVERYCRNPTLETLKLIPKRDIDFLGKLASEMPTKIGVRTTKLYQQYLHEKQIGIGVNSLNIICKKIESRNLSGKIEVYVNEILVLEITQYDSVFSMINFLNSHEISFRYIGLKNYLSDFFAKLKLPPTLIIYDSKTIYTSETNTISPEFAVPYFDYSRKTFLDFYQFLTSLSVLEFREYCKYERWQGENLLESLYRLVVYLKLIPELSNAKVCEGCYTLGQAIPTKKSLNDLLKLPLKDRGDVSDLTLLEGNTLFVTTSKDYMSKGVPSYHVGKLDLEKLVEAMPQYSGRNFRLIVIVNEKSALLKAMERAEMSSLNLVKRLKDPNTLIYDFDDLIRCFRPIRLYNEPINLSVRFHQRLAMLRICELLRETKKVLYNAVCRSGKSYTMMDLILELRPKKCLILTTKPSETIVDLEKMCREYLVGYDVVKLRKGVEPSDSKTIYLGSKQFLDEKESSIDCLENLDLALLDEFHFGGTTKLTFTTIYERYLTNSSIVFFTATGSKPATYYNLKSIVNWTMKNLRDCETGNFTELYSEYGEELVNSVLEEFTEDEIRETYSQFPIMRFHRTSLNPELKTILRESDGGWSLKGLFQMTGEEFKYEEQVASFMKYCLSMTETKSLFRVPYKSVLSEIYRSQKASSSVNENLRLPQQILVSLNPNHISVVGNALIRLFKKHRIATEYIPIVVSENDLRGQTAIEYVNAVTAEAENAKKHGVIIFTGRMLNEGVTMPKCDIVFMLGDTKSYDLYTQIIYRCMTEDVGKTIGNVVDVNIHRIIVFAVLTAKENYPHLKPEKSIERVITDKLIQYDGVWDELFNVNETPINEQAKVIYHEFIRELKVSISHLTIETPIEFKREWNRILEFGKIKTERGDSRTAYESIDRDVDTGVSSKRVDDEDEKDLHIDRFKQLFPVLCVVLIVLTLDRERLIPVEYLFDEIYRNRTKRNLLLNQLEISCGKKLTKKEIKLSRNTFNKLMTTNEKVKVSLESIKEQFQFLRNDGEKLYELVLQYFIPTDVEVKNNAEILTPMKWAKKMMKTVPENVFKKEMKIFEPCAGKGVFLLESVRILMKKLRKEITDENERYRHIVEKILYFGDINPMNVFICSLILNPENKYRLNSYTGDTLQLDPMEQWGIKKFDLIVSNPPYSTNPSNPNTTPLYNLFIEKYIDKTAYLLFIIPSKWFSGGKGLDKFRAKMLSRTDIAAIHHFENSNTVFDKVNLMGGVNYFLKVPYKTECEFNGLKIDLTKYDVLIDPKHLTIVDHLWEKQSLKSIREIFLPRSTFPINTDGTHRITHELLFNKDGDTVCWVSSKQSVDRKLRVDSSKISSFKQTWKVITAEANGNQPNFGFMTSIKPNEIFTDSYIGFKVSSEQEANSLVSYLKCKLPNFLLALRKLTQHISNSTVKWIPLPPLDRTWTNENVYEYFSIDSSLQKLIK